MIADFSSILLDPIYETLGVPATIVTASSAASETVTAIDKTAGVEVEDGAMVSIRPVAAVRVAELTEKGLTRSDLNGGSITLNGVTWSIKLTAPKPNPQGDGELYLILEQ